MSGQRREPPLAAQRSVADKRNAWKLHSHFLGFHFDLRYAEEASIPSLQEPGPIQIVVRFHFGSFQAIIFASFCGYRFFGEFCKPEAHRRFWTQFPFNYVLFGIFSSLFENKDYVGNSYRNVTMVLRFIHVQRNWWKSKLRRRLTLKMRYDDTFLWACAVRRGLHARELKCMMLRISYLLFYWDVVTLLLFLGRMLSLRSRRSVCAHWKKNCRML